jgi:hypothetical protein
MGLQSGRLRDDLMSNYVIGKLTSLFNLQIHASRSSLCRLPSGAKKQPSQPSLQMARPRIPQARKSSWKGPNKPGVAA